MAALFLLMACVVTVAFFGKRFFAITLLLITLGFCWLMLWYHATDALKINW
jgi:hypothetical protein